MELNVNLFLGEPNSHIERRKTSNNPGRTRTLCYFGNRQVLEERPESWRTCSPERLSVRKRIFGPKKSNRPLQAMSFDADCERINEEIYEDWKTADTWRDKTYRLQATDFTRSRLSKTVGKNYKQYDSGIDADYRSRRSKRRKSHQDYENDFSTRGSERYVRVASYDILYPRNSKAKEWAPFSSKDFLSRTRREFDETVDRINDDYYRESSDSEILGFDPDSRIVPADDQNFSYNPRSKAVGRGKSQNVELFEIFASESQEQNPSTFYIRHKNNCPIEGKVYKESKLPPCIKEPNEVGKQAFVNNPEYNLKSFSSFEYESYPKLDKDSYRSKTNYSIREDELKICNDITDKTNRSMDVNYGMQNNMESVRAEDQNGCQSFKLGKWRQKNIEIPTDHDFSKHDIVTVEDEFNEYSPTSELVISGVFSPNPSKRVTDMVQEKVLINQTVPQLSSSSEDEDHSNEIVLFGESSGKSSSTLLDEEGKKNDSQPILEQTEAMAICLPAESESSSVNLVGYRETLNHNIENDGYQKKSYLAKHKALEVNLEPVSKTKLLETPERKGRRYDDDVIQYTPSLSALTESDIVSPLTPQCRGNEVESIAQAMVDSWDVISPTKVGNLKFANEMCYRHDIAGLPSVEFGIVTNDSIDVVSNSKTRKVIPKKWKYRGTPSNLLNVSKVKSRRKSVAVTLGSNEGCVDNKDSVSKRRNSMGGLQHENSSRRYKREDFMNCLQKSASSRGLV